MDNKKYLKIFTYFYLVGILFFFSYTIYVAMLFYETWGILAYYGVIVQGIIQVLILLSIVKLTTLERNTLKRLRIL